MRRTGKLLRSSTILMLSLLVVLLALHPGYAETSPAGPEPAAAKPAETQSQFGPPSPHAPHAVHTVCGIGPPTCDFDNIQAAVDAAGAGDVIKVAYGTYSDVWPKPAPPQYPGPAVITQSIYITKEITIRGGYDIDFHEPPDPVYQPTTVDAQGQGRVVLIAGWISPTVEGLRITGGDASGQSGSGNGFDRGGGVYVFRGTPTIRNNHIYHNTSPDIGGGIGTLQSYAIIRDNVIYSNTAFFGGGLYVQDYTPWVEGNTIRYNLATSDGGGLYVSNCDGLIEGNLIAHNRTVLHNGGGMYLAFHAPTLRGNVIRFNTANRRGGGLYLWGVAGTVVNNVIVDNNIVLNDHGTAIHFEAGTPILLHNTFARNSGGQGTALYVRDSWGNLAHVTMTNNIIVSHTIGIQVDDFYTNTAFVDGVLWYSNTTNVAPIGIITLTGEITGNPMFRDGYHIRSDSAAKDVAAYAGVDDDIDGEARPYDAGYDLGADEYSTRCFVRLNDGGPTYDRIQLAVDASTDPADVVKVAGYCDGLNNRGALTQVVYLTKTLTLRGGYTTSNDFADPPDPLAYPTTIAAQGLGRGLYIAGFISPTVEGLRITGGNAEGLGGIWGFDSGGGALVISASAILSDCWIVDNSSFFAFGGGLALANTNSTLQNSMVFSNTAGYGGGVFTFGGDDLLRGNHIANNYVYDQGGGVAIFNARATLEGNVVSGNTADPEYIGSGAGVFADQSQVTLIGNTLAHNRAGFGGGLEAEDSQFTLIGNDFLSNTVEMDGAGASMAWGSAVLEGNLFSANQAGDYGGGLATWEVTATLNGDTFSHNTSPWGGGLFLWESPAVLTNTLIVDNEGTFGGGLTVQGHHVRVRHSTIARNHGGSGVTLLEGSYTETSLDLVNTILVSHSIGITVSAGCTATLEATLWGSGPWANGTDWAGAGHISTGTINLWEPPGFVAAELGDYHIDASSDARDAGVYAGVDIDIDGEPRPLGPGYDLGVDEFLPEPALVVLKTAWPDPVTTGAPLTYTLYVSNTGNVALNASISDQLPAQVSPSDPLTWTAQISIGEVWQQDVVVTVNVGYVGPLVNVVQVTTEEGAAGRYTHTLEVVDAPVWGLSAFNDSPTALGDPTAFTATVSGGSNVAYAWAFGDGSSASGDIAAHTYADAGTYTAVVTAGNSAGWLTATTTVLVEEPIAGLQAFNDSPTALGDPTAFTATVSGGSNIAYAWAFGEGSIASGDIAAHTYADAGIYTAIVTASNSAGWLTATTTVLVEEPIADLQAFNDSPTMEGEITVLSATVAAGSNVVYTWDLGDGDNTSGAIITHTYPTVGTYTAVVTASNSISWSATSTVVYVVPYAALYRVYLPLVFKSYP